MMISHSPCCCCDCQDRPKLSQLLACKQPVTVLNLQSLMPCAIAAPLLVWYIAAPAARHPGGGGG